MLLLYAKLWLIAICTMLMMSCVVAVLSHRYVINNRPSNSLMPIKKKRMNTKKAEEIQVGYTVAKVSARNYN